MKTYNNICFEVRLAARPPWRPRCRRTDIVIDIADHVIQVYLDQPGKCRQPAAEMGYKK